MKQQPHQIKQLPRRSSRGVRPQLSQEQTQQDDKIYANLFGNLDDESESDGSFSQMFGLKPLQIFTINFQNFNYGRGYHYFFDLNTFPRAESSPSYAIDDKNRFNYTYSHDQQEIKGTKIKNIINRKYIGLPSIETTYDKRKSHDKNVCHYHLFNIEDKKFHNSRMICKYKYVLKHLEQLHKTNKLKYYTQIKKDAVTREVCQRQVSIEKKKQILQHRIKVLEERVKNMEPYWDWEDNIYYHFSLDQIFHNQAMLKGQKLSEKNLEDYILKRLTQRRQYIQSLQYGQLCLGVDKLRHAVETWVTFQEQNDNGLSTTMQNRLKAMPKIIEMFRRKQQLVIFPLFTFFFGSTQINQFIDPLIKAKFQNEDQSCFYVYKAFVKRLLRRDLACQQGRVLQPILPEQYHYEMRKKIVEIEDFYKNDVYSHKKKVYLDDLVQMERIENSPIEQRVNLLQPSFRLEINIKELMLLFFYRNISIALQQILQYLKHDPEILKFIADPNYDKYHYAIAKIIHKPEFCILINDVTRFATILNTRNVSPNVDQTFHFTFNSELGVAYAWKQQASNDWETEKDDDQQMQEQDSGQKEQLSQEKPKQENEQENSLPKKKIKTD